MKKREKERKNIMHLLSGLLSIDGITVHGDKSEKRNAAISISAKTKDNAILAERLLEHHQIETRVGLHCAPSAHKVLGTYPEGTIRLSPGPFTESFEIDETLRAIREETR